MLTEPIPCAPPPRFHVPRRLRRGYHQHRERPFRLLYLRGRSSHSDRDGEHHLYLYLRQFRQLATLNNWQFSYDTDGMRTERYHSDGTAYTYYYSGSQLARMVVLDGDVYGSYTFRYDANGMPLSMTYSVEVWVENGYWDDDGNYIDDSDYVYYDGTYYYVTNAQGDVIALTDESGNRMAAYTYDAWGKPLTTTYSGADYEVVEYNPLRYRGYVYDSETGLYYLQSRYSDPEIGRFINADAFVSTGQGFVGNNMFAYCLNNPINGSDPCGSCFHRLDFWNDCDKCGGRAFEEKWDDFTSKIEHYQKQQTEIEEQILREQVEIIEDGAETLWDAYNKGLEMKQEAQLTNTTALIEGIEHLANNPEESVDLAIAMGGISTVTYKIVMVATVGNPVTGIVGSAIFAVWGLYRAVKSLAEMDS